MDLETERQRVRFLFVTKFCIFFYFVYWLDVVVDISGTPGFCFSFLLFCPVFGDGRRCRREDKVGFFFSTVIFSI